MSNALCCCEYIDEEGRKNHLCACCCDCVALDLVCDRIIRCKSVPNKLFRKMVNTMNDRMRVPWKGGAKKFSFEAVVPFVLIPIAFLCAAQGLWLSVVTYSFVPIFLIYIHYVLMKFHSRSQFFLMWSIASIVYTFIIFELIGVRLLEIRLDENMGYTVLTICIFVCMRKVKAKQHMNYITCDYEDPEAKVNMLCPECNLRVPSRTFHCWICQSCILKRDLHCAWINCCIGYHNHHWYMLLLLSSFTQMVLCSNLILTTACHPFSVWGDIMLPDDCSDVYYDMLYAICFVTALYCLEAAVFLLSILLHECWMISTGVSGHEFRNRSRRFLCCCLLPSSPYSKGFIRNWIRYFKGLDMPALPHNI